MKSLVKSGDNMKNDKKRKKISRGNFFIYLFLFLFTVISFIFFGWMFFSSFRTNQELFKSIWALPTTLNFINYVKAWVVGRFQTLFTNSIIVTTTSVFLAVLVSALASYSFARLDFRTSKFVYILFIAGLAIPVPLVIIPLYLLLHNMGLIDSRIGLILVYIALIIPFSIFLLTEYMKTIPKEIEESALIDGCSEFIIFWKIILPLSMPGVITVFILNFFAIWNEFFLALVLVIDVNKATVPLGLGKLQAMQNYGGDWTTLFAGVLICIIPTVILFIIMQNRIISGLTAGAIKN